MRGIASVRVAASVGLAAMLALASMGPAYAAPPAPIACDTTQGACWHPALNARWQYQLQGVAAYASTGGINVGISAVPYTGGAAVSPSVFDFDLFVDQTISGNNTTLNTAGVNAVHAAGKSAICYLSAGSWENWRADAGQFPASVLGNKNGWPGEKWLDIRQTGVLLPIMEARVQKCRQAGFDGVEEERREQLVDLAPYFDYAVNEQCQQYDECGGYTTHFINAGKPVFQVEYKLQPGKFCPQASSANRNAILKDFDLFDTPYTPCR